MLQSEPGVTVREESSEKKRSGLRIDHHKENPAMKRHESITSLLILALAFTTASMAQDSPSSLTSACERQLKGIEKNIIDAAEAMPEDKFDFTPENLSIQGSAFKGVRTFAGEVKHLAADNYIIWSPVTGDPLPDGIKDSNGPKDLKTKAEIVRFLKDSFTLGHKAIGTLTSKNAMEMVSLRGNKLPRLDLAFYAMTHANDHYGQMVVYLRLCGIIPPASRPK
jgi:uncharacterized damage-inducible protein DinB